MLKSLPDIDYSIPASTDKVLGLTDELLCYAYETERTDPSPTSSLVEVLDEVDRVNTHHARGTGNHWTRARSAVDDSGYDMYREEYDCNFLALAVQARLVKYVRAKLDANPNNARKCGRPLLDYALRPRPIKNINTEYRSKRDGPSVDVDSKSLLHEIRVRHALTSFHHLYSGTATPRTRGRSKSACSSERQQVSLAPLFTFNGRDCLTVSFSSG